MSKITFEEFYDKRLDEEVEYLNLSDPIGMEEFRSAIKEEYNQYLERASPGKIQNVQSADYFSSLQEKYIKGFDVECFNSLIPARIYFIQTLSLIFKKENGNKINSNKDYEIKDKQGKKDYSTNLHFYWQQDTSSGKSRGHKYFLKNIRALSKLIARNSKMKTAHRYTIQSTKWTETQETFINRFQQIQTKKGLQLDFTAPPVKGIFENADVLASEECAFLFNEKQTTKQNISELLLDSLEGNVISKTLVGWNGHETQTKPNFIFSGLSRPTRNISSDFFSKGLFQRMLIYTRTVTPAMRAKAVEKSSMTNRIEKSYLDMLAKEFEDLYRWKLKNNPKELTFKDEEKIKKLILNAYYDKVAQTNKAFKHNFNITKDVNGFLSRYYSNLIYVLMILLCLSRKSTIIEEQDFKEADYILNHSILSIQQFSETNIKPDIVQIKNDDVMKARIFQFFSRQKNAFIARKDLELYLKKILKKSLGYINDNVNKFIDIEFLIEKDDKIHINKIDYEEIKESIKSQSTSKRYNRK